MDGEIKVYSKVGSGSTFSCLVFVKPSSRKNVERSQDESVGRYLPITQGKRVLLAEDNQMNRQLLKKMVEELGMLCDVAEDGQAAFELASKKEYDLILMDYLMPRMNGIEAALAIKQKSLNQRTPIVALSASYDEATQKMIQAAGVNGFVAKPVTLAQLKDALEKHLIDTKLE